MKATKATVANAAEISSNNTATAKSNSDFPDQARAANKRFVAAINIPEINIAFISLMVDRTYTATQYALLASIGTLGRTTLAASSGELVDWLNGDWGIFFVITTVMVIPSLILLWFIRNKLKLQ